jgi:hypothetical protein
MKNLTFLKSIRFWKVVIVAALIGLQKEGVIAEGTWDTVVTALEAIIGASVVIRTVDRASEKIGG